MIRPCLVNMINDHKNQSEWKIQLSAEINFISSKPDSDETRIMYTKSNNIEIMIGNDTNEVIKELFKKMRASEFVFDAVNVLYYDLNKITLNRGESYIDSPKWIKNKKATINPNNNDTKCFQYALTIAFNYQIIKKKSSTNKKY